MGPEGRVASVDGGAVLWVAQAVEAQKVCVGDHRSGTVVVAGAPRAVGRTVLPQNGSGLGPEGAPQVVVQEHSVGRLRIDVYAATPWLGRDYLVRRQGGYYIRARGEESRF